MAEAASPQCRTRPGQRVSRLLVTLLAIAGVAVIDSTVAPRGANAQVITACTSVAGSTNLNSEPDAGEPGTRATAQARVGGRATSRLNSSRRTCSRVLGNV